ncbi:hypothetical protein FB45DRAFT_1141377 [Roridomyces roridus]|uniref:F-box domain-containing protein n=1 Tax=Roridomyces roridus TaxID=1738132 RepID=A0AAD7BYJ5_9AGAR|nr:hypothetical protein FB45DRAFT_1119355 [Roridomyces roridus]KAJ7634426.1 hypothetical protein FB45DRAFT_1141377 [Roridomyces roridus]
MASFPPIQLSPPELLSEIFQHLLSHDLFSAAQVCGLWREAALGHASLWTRVTVSPESLSYPHGLGIVLRRSKNLPITLEFLIPPSQPGETPNDYAALWRLLTYIIIPELARCASLRVIADEVACGTITSVFFGHKFPLLRSLHLVNMDVDPHWQVVLAGSELPPVPPSFLYFDLPEGHALEECVLHGFTLGYHSLPDLKSLSIVNHNPSLLDSGGALNPQLFAVPTDLRLDNLCIPVIDLPKDDVLDPCATGLTTLHLSRVRGMPLDSDEDGSEWDGMEEYHSGPFFNALNTSRVRSLTMEEWDAAGQVVEDFISTLPLKYPKFPELTHLCLRRMELGPPEGIMRLLRAMPALRELKIEECPETAQVVFEVLCLDEKLCPGVRQVETGDGLLSR